MLTPAHLQQAVDALQDHDAVLIPPEDGGYVLLGLRRPVAEVFDGVAWSTPCWRKPARSWLPPVRWWMPALWDVDEPADWRGCRPGRQRMMDSFNRTVA